LSVVGGGLLLALLFSQSGTESLLKGHDAFRYGRLNIWKAAVAACAEKPLFGWGPGCFERAYLQHNFPSFNGF
ncbi:MAG TPA: hypothetical protein PLL10_08185, partial [Elusimicrobiales bacterium]|nr:hypothetical protein [Elusimicrobiales bacterium]